MVLDGIPEGTDGIVPDGIAPDGIALNGTPPGVTEGSVPDSGGAEGVPTWAGGRTAGCTGAQGDGPSTVGIVAVTVGPTAGELTAGATGVTRVEVMLAGGASLAESTDTTRARGDTGAAPVAGGSLPVDGKVFFMSGGSPPLDGSVLPKLDDGAGGRLPGCTVLVGYAARSSSVIERCVRASSLAMRGACGAVERIAGSTSIPPSLCVMAGSGGRACADEGAATGRGATIPSSVEPKLSAGCACASGAGVKG
jgi:hypothetical protein